MPQLLKVWIVGPDAEATPFFLCEGTRSSSSPSGLKVHGAVEVQASARFRAARKRFRNRLNLAQSISFDTQRLFSDDSLASGFMLLHSATIPRDGTVYFEQETSSGTVKTKMENAVIATDDSMQKGSTTFHSYSIMGGGMVAAT